MKQKIWAALAGIICLVGLVSYGLIGLSQTPQPTVSLTTEPAMETLRPFAAATHAEQRPATLTLAALDATGQPRQNARMHLRLLTPPPTPWFTTDFPIVEGTTLLDLTLPAPQGRVQVQQMLPIRGVYQLQVEVTPQVANAFAPMQQTLPLAVGENPAKYRNFALLALILLGVGLAGGWVIGQRRLTQPGELAPQAVRLLLSGATVAAIAVLLYINISAEMMQSHHAMAMSHPTKAAPLAEHPRQLQAHGLQVQLTGDDAAIVGELAHLQLQVTDAKTQQPVPNLAVAIASTQLEEGWRAFASEGVTDAQGTLKWQQQFFDGAPHQVDVTVTPSTNARRQFPPIQVAQTLAVEGVAPPLPVRLATLAYLTGFVAIGLLLGIGLNHRRPPRLYRPLNG